jgi:prophage regulatory protein
MARTLIRLKEALARTGHSRSTFYEKVESGEISKPVRLGARIVAWPEDEIDAYVEARIAERDAGYEPKPPNRKRKSGQAARAVSVEA